MNNYPFNLERGTGNVTVTLKKNEGFPPIPYELQNLYSSEIWANRIQAASQLCRRWSRPTVERLYFVLIIILQFALPSVITNLILVQAYANRDRDRGRDRDIPPDKIFEFRAISMAIFFGVFILFWTPLITWKLMGKRRVRALESEWLVLDRATHAGGYIPRWSITKPGIFSSTAALRVSLPSVPVYITSFHPNAPLPPYVNPPGTGPAQYGYTYPPDEKTALPVPERV